MLQVWYFNAKERLYLRNLIKDIADSKKQNACQKCGINIELNLVEIISFNQILRKFRVQFVGYPFNKYQWREFYQ